MCEVSNVLGTEEKKMAVTVPQLFVASKGGFSTDYYRDHPASVGSYWCFWAVTVV